MVRGDRECGRVARKGLALEAGHALAVVRTAFGQYSERNVAFQPGIFGSIDFAVPPAPMGARISYGPKRFPAQKGIMRRQSRRAIRIQWQIQGLDGTPRRERRQHFSVPEGTVHGFGEALARDARELVSDLLIGLITHAPPLSSFQYSIQTRQNPQSPSKISMGVGIR